MWWICHSLALGNLGEVFSKHVVDLSQLNIMEFRGGVLKTWWIFHSLALENRGKGVLKTCGGFVTA